MLVRNATLADGRVRDVRIEGERIDAVGSDLAADGAETVDARERLLLPGAVDAHVHFREPGAPHKETWRTGSQSAAAGGVTTVVDQPNTDPPTTTGAAYDQKELLAQHSLVDYGINGGVTPDWDPETLFDRPVFALGEVFLADSTGDMGIDGDRFEDAVHRAAEAGVPVTVHAEDATLFDDAARDDAGSGTGHDANADAWSAYRAAEAEIAAVERAVEVGADAGVRLHVAHTSTPEAVDIVADAPDTVTCEVTPHHCLLSRADLDDLGTYGRMNPPLRSEERRAALYDRVVDGRVDLIATDHAPHTKAEKEATLLDAPSGVPGVETMVPLLLAETLDGPLTVERVRDLTAAAPAATFDLDRKGKIEAGMDADLALYDLDRSRSIAGERLHSKCGWTPFEGLEGVFPEWTLRRGDRVYDGAMDTFGSTDGKNVR
ncbi:dihydroorotase [Haloplanus vescus]|uniref:Dihydroorotase n=1 Tax=Haloplanus vescus TaxID=555874 RepID=A0A1H3X8S1_9EURY|nr:dihydroorotase [Haloplanus vescus]SDZ95640.1 dihydroorotase [Haloplanus vescus]